MLGDPLGFADYAVNDAVIAVLYCHELWGCNHAMPVILSRLVDTSDTRIMEAKRPC